MVLSAVDSKRLFQKLCEEKINIVYVKAPIELGMTNDFMEDR